MFLQTPTQRRSFPSVSCWLAVSTFTLLFLDIFPLGVWINDLKSKLNKIIIMQLEGQFHKEISGFMWQCVVTT